MEQNKPIVLILCGGQSLRLWPLSEYRSKNFIDIFGFSPLELTIKRFLEITSRDNIFLAANKQEAAALYKLNQVKKENIILEPESKNTAPAILLSIFYLRKKFPRESKIIIAPVDHLIEGDKYFYSALKKALASVNRGGIAVLGIVPSRAVPDFGYIQAGQEVSKDVFCVSKFIEKPSLACAVKLIKKKHTYYNSGMFISTLAALDREFKTHYGFYDDFSAVLDEAKPLIGKLRRLYRKIDKIPFDKAIMEKVRMARVVKCNFGWKDFGNWNAVYEVLVKDKNNNVKKGKVSIKDSKGNLIYVAGGRKKVLVMGINDTVFVDTPKYALLTRRACLDSLKANLKIVKSNF